MSFAKGLQKVAAKFRFGGYAMDLFKESKNMPKAAIKPKLPAAATSAAATTQKVVSDTLTPSAKATLKTVTPRPFKYGDM